MLTHVLRPFALALSLVLLPLSALAADTLRPAVGKPLQDAKKLMDDKQYKDALPKIAEAEAVGALTEYESFVVNQMRGAAAAGAGDTNLAAQSFEKVLQSKRLPAEEQLKISEAVAGTYLRARNYPKAIQWIQYYRDNGGQKPDTLNFLPQAYYLAGDFKKSTAESAALIGKAEKAGGRPTEDQLKLYASALIKQNDMVGYTQALERLVRYYPKPEYWADVIQRTATKPGFNKKLDLDMYRLLRATGNLKQAKDYSEMAQLAVQAGLPGEAKAIVDEGYEKKILGAGPEAERHTRLKTLVEKKMAEDQKIIASTDKQAAAAATGDPLVKTGLAYVTYGDATKGLPMIEQGIKKGQLKSQEMSKLHLGYAYWYAGDKSKAITALRQVQGKDGAADFARLWTIIAARGA